MKVACILVPHLPVQVERQSDPSLSEKPLVVGGRPWDEGAVLDCCPGAAAAGVHPGMRLAQAEALCPTASFLPAREGTYRAVHDLLVAVAGHFTPIVETAGLGLLYAEVSGLERAIGPDAELARRLSEETARACGLRVGVGLAETKFTAEQAACAASPGRGCVVPPDEERTFLSSLPLDALPADLEMRRRLELLGIHTLGAFAALPRLAVIRQFGAPAGLLHDLACGLDQRPVCPDAPPLAVERQRIFEEPLGDLNVLLAHTRQMATELGETLTRHSYQAEGLRLRLETPDQAGRASGAAVKPPSADPAKLARLVARLVEQEPGPVGGVTALVLTGYPLRPAYLGAVQLSFLDQTEDNRLQQLREVVRGLRARFGELVIVVASLLGPPPPARIQVLTDPEGTPRALVWHDQIQPVVAVYESWRERLRWWCRPVERDYFRLEVVPSAILAGRANPDGQMRVVFRDIRADRWLLERRHI